MLPNYYIPKEGMKRFLFLLFLVIIHTFPLWNYTERLAGGLGDPLAHAAIGDFFCGNIIQGDWYTDKFQAPHGVDISGNYDSPFPFIATCAFTSLGSVFQFHLFTFLQLLLIVTSSFLVARHFLKDNVLQVAYVLFAWWTGFYIAKSHDHMTLLSQIWGAQFVLYALLSVNFSSARSVLINSFLLGLSFIGTFQNIPGLFVLTVGLALFRIFQNPHDFKKIVVIRNIFFGLTLSLGLFVLAWYPMIQFHLAHTTPLLNPQNFRYSFSLKWTDLVTPYGSHIFSSYFKPTYLGSESTNTLDIVIVLALVGFAVTKKFWQNRLTTALVAIAAVYLTLALGPAFGFNEFIFRQFPFYLTRVPSRMALFFYLCLLLVTFIHFDLLQNLKFKKYLGFVLIAYIFIAGPVLNNMYFFPTVVINSFIPKKGLAEFKELSDKNIVVNIPSSWAGDQSQNFLQLYHNKKITSGYLAYTAYTLELFQKAIKSPLLGHTGCKGQPLEFTRTAFHSDFTQLKNYLIENNLTLFIFNKSSLFRDASCKDLADWSLLLARQPWMTIVDENDAFVLTRIK